MRNFKESEFACKCGCGTNNMSRHHITWLSYARDLAGVPFRITSGCRCFDHNKAEGGSTDSSHIANDKKECTATDIACKDSRNRYIIIKALIEAGFKRIGIAKTFIHADSDKAKDQLVIWVY